MFLRRASSMILGRTSFRDNFNNYVKRVTSRPDSRCATLLAHDTVLYTCGTRYATVVWIGQILFVGRYYCTADSKNEITWLQLGRHLFSTMFRVLVLAFVVSVVYELRLKLMIAVIVAWIPRTSQNKFWTRSSKMYSGKFTGKLLRFACCFFVLWKAAFFMALMFVRLLARTPPKMHLRNN